MTTTDISKGTAQDIAKAAALPNPANPQVKRLTEATRVPMSLPNSKLSVPEVPGYFLYWHLGKNVPAALRAGYTHVEADEVDLEQTGVATGAEESGSTDMGTRVSVLAGADESGGLNPERLYLMKLPNEWRNADMAAQARVNEEIAVALRAGNIGAEADPDRNKRYMKKGQDLFYPKQSIPGLRR